MTTEPLFECLTCDQIGSVGRCCGLETRKPLNQAAVDELQAMVSETDCGQLRQAEQQPAPATAQSEKQ